MGGTAWHDGSGLRIGLGCMRLSTDEERDEERALETIVAAAKAGIRVFDTAHAYGHSPDELGHNEALLAKALRAYGAAETARIVTKGGMTRAGGGWVADGRAKAIRADAEASLTALDGLPIDLYLIHAPDPRVGWATSVRSLAKLADEGLVAHIGVANVNRRQLDEALELAPISAVQVALNPYDDGALRGGVLQRCVEAGVALIAHTPLGGRIRAARLGRREPLAAIAEAHDSTPAEIALAWLLGLSPAVVAIPGARRPDTARSAVRAASIELTPDEQARLTETFGGPWPVPERRRRSQATDAEVAVVMGIPGAGKTRYVVEHPARGYLRLNRDEHGGSLRELAAKLDEELAAGARRIVLDNTYLTRASRSYVIQAAHRHSVPVRCVWLDTPLAQAQVNVVERLLERFDRLPAPEDLGAATRRPLPPGLHTPTTQMRTFRELEPPTEDEGFDEVERVPFVRTPPTWGERPGVFVAAGTFEDAGWEHAIEQGEPDAPHLVFDWSPDGAQAELAQLATRLSAVVTGPVESALCPHPGGPPICWCRPPLPGLLLAFARAHRVDPARSLLVGTSRAHETLATTLGARYVSSDPGARTTG